MTLRAALEAAHPGATVIGDDRYAALADDMLSLHQGDGEVIAVRYRRTIDTVATAATAEEALAKLKEMT